MTLQEQSDEYVKDNIDKIREELRMVISDIYVKEQAIASYRGELETLYSEKVRLESQHESFLKEWDRRILERVNIPDTGQCQDCD